MDVGDLRRQVQEKLDRLRAEAQRAEQFLSELDRWTASEAPTGGPAVQVLPAKDPEPPAAPKLRRIPPAQKNKMVLAILNEHGKIKPQTIKEMLIAQGIDADAGTPIKRVCWDLAHTKGKATHYKEENAYGPLVPVASQNGHRRDLEELKL
jgi:hypothetical protein